MITWILLRAAGVGAYLMLFASVAWGLLGTTSLVAKRVAKPTAVAIHQFCSTVALVLLGVHLSGLLVDRFMPFGFLDVLVPLHSSFRPVATAFGVLAMYLMVVVLASSWMRKRIGTTWWRRLHLLAVPAFTMAMVHGAFAGTDTARPWMWWTYVGTGGVVLFLVLARGLTSGLRVARAHHDQARVPATARATRAARPGGAGVAPPSSQDPSGRAAPPPPDRVTVQWPGREDDEVVLRLDVHVVLDDRGRPKVAGATVADPHRLTEAEPASNGHHPT
jgi:DMSO/TMAO reductase YedYZ heme-binding membrane subunit